MEIEGENGVDGLNDDDHKPLDVELEDNGQEDQPAVDAPSGINPADEINQGIEDLKTQLENEKRERAEADRRASEASQRAASAADEVNRARAEARDSNATLINSALDQFKQRGEAMKERLAQAMSLQDFSLAAEIQSDMAENAARYAQLEAQKNHFDNAPKPQPYQARQSPPSDPVEALASNLSTRSAAWVRAHPEYATDARLNQKMIAAHQFALADGNAVDSDGYFSKVEQILGIAAPAQQAPEAAAATPAPKPRQSPPPVAPTSNSGGRSGSSSGSPRTVRLSAQEVEMAEMMGMTPKEYATNKAALQRDGLLAR